jgi:hypothetical protein
MFQFPQYIQEISPKEFHTSKIIFESAAPFVIGQQMLSQTNLFVTPLKTVEIGKGTSVQNGN